MEVDARSSSRGFLAISPATLASYCAFVLAAAIVAFGITYLLLPARIGDVQAALFQAGSQPGWYQVFFGEWALTGLLGLAVVGPATRLLVGRAGGWSDWMAKLAYLGFALTAVQSVHNLVVMPGLGQLFQGCGTCTASLADQQTLAKWLYISLPLDPMNWITVGTVGLWILTVSAIGFGTMGVPKSVLYLGIASAVLYLAVVVLGSIELPLDLLIIVASVVAAIWYAWVGVLLRRQT
jgi:hypothetical protein